MHSLAFVMCFCKIQTKYIYLSSILIRRNQTICGPAVDVFTVYKHLQQHLNVWLLVMDTCIFHVFVQQVLQVLLLVIVELSLQCQQNVFVQQHPDQVEGTWRCQNMWKKTNKTVGQDGIVIDCSVNIHRWFDSSSASSLSAV